MNREILRLAIPKYYVDCLNFIFILIFLLKDLIGNHALWLSMNAFMLESGLLQTFYYTRLPMLRER